jgi:aryl-alcohol dehydrogenase-like predicted oxidoreductase
MCDVLAEIAKKHNVDGINPIALAWLFAKYSYCYPVVGMYTTEVSFPPGGGVHDGPRVDHPQQLQQNIAAACIHLDEEDVAKIDGGLSAREM